jgi:hypothetical protein
MSTGIRKRGRAYEASVWNARENKRLRKSFGSLREAKDWRAETRLAVNTDTTSTATQATLREAWNEWLEGAESGLIRTRSGDRYKPSALHGCRQTMARHARRKSETTLSTRSPVSNSRTWPTSSTTRVSTRPRSATC